MKYIQSYTIFICTRINLIHISTKCDFPVYVVLLCHDNFDIITYEKAALYDTGNGFELFFERRINIVKTGVEDEIPIFCKDRPVFAVGWTQDDF